MKYILKQKRKGQQLIFWIPSNECCCNVRGKCYEGRQSQLWTTAWRDKGLIKVDRQALFTADNDDSVVFGGFVMAWRPGGPSFMLANGNLEGETCLF